MSVQSIVCNGYTGLLIDIECHLSNNLPTIIIVGFANKAVSEARERIRGAFACSRILLPRKRVIINLAPADIPKADSGFDLAIAVAILQASGQLQRSLERDTAVVGELGLDGSVRPVRGIIGKLLYGRTKGITSYIIPRANLQQAQLVPGLQLIAVDSLSELYCHLTHLTTLDIIYTQDGSQPMSHNIERELGIGFSEVAGQGQAKRALEIAAAGGHNVFLNGPPGTGKSMLAKAMANIMPAMSREEILEVTHVHSLASRDYERIVTDRPFRSPHHSASQSAIIGGGARLTPGEISLSHRGILFMDELPEFARGTLEALRQPLEDKVITIARSKDTSEFPANCILVATANPCPCGYYGVSDAAQACSCSGWQIQTYKRRISGPILDRIDLHAPVHAVEHSSLLAQKPNQEEDTQLRQRIAVARSLQAKRYGTTSKLNADMSNADIRLHAQINSKGTSLLNMAAHSLQLSARAYMRTVKVARTIADLEQKTTITEAHISDALAYRAPVNNKRS